MISLQSLDSLIHSRTLLQHPFYLKWSKGELTKEDMKIYAKEYFHLVQAIPGIVSQLANAVEDEDLKVRIEQNAMEEADHAILWKRFALALGISEQELNAYEPSALAKSAVALLQETCAKSKDDGIAAMYALEMELPEIARTKKEGLAAFYGLTSEDAQIYFDEHLKEEAHLAVWRAFEVRNEAEQAAKASLTAQHQMLDAVCKEAGINMDC